jgi:hypothetical protein
MLSHVGQVLYGDWWQTQLANALGLSDRQMRRWVGMEAHIPSPILGEVLPRLSMPRFRNSPRFLMF